MGEGKSVIVGVTMSRYIQFNYIAAAFENAAAAVCLVFFGGGGHTKHNNNDDDVVDVKKDNGRSTN